MYSPMRRQDKEADGHLSLQQIIKAQGFIRLGFFCEGKTLIRPVMVKEFSLRTITVEDICHSGKVSFQAHIYNGIKTSGNICSFSSRYLSVYGVGMMEDDCINIDFVTGKQSAFNGEIVGCTQLSRQFILHSTDINLSETIQLGIPCSDELYITPVQHGQMGDSLYFHSAKMGRKHSLLSAQPHIVIQWDTKADNNGAVFYSNSQAEAFKVPDSDEKCKAMEAIVFKTAGVNAAFTLQDLKNTEIFKIKNLPYR